MQFPFDKKQVAERFTKWKSVGNTKYLLPIHTIIGKNTDFTITGGADVESMAKNVEPCPDIKALTYGTSSDFSMIEPRLVRTLDENSITVSKRTAHLIFRFEKNEDALKGLQRSPAGI